MFSVKKSVFLSMLMCMCGVGIAGEGKENFDDFDKELNDLIVSDRSHHKINKSEISNSLFSKQLELLIARYEPKVAQNLDQKLRTGHIKIDEVPNDLSEIAKFVESAFPLIVTEKVVTNFVPKIDLRGWIGTPTIEKNIGKFNNMTGIILNMGKFEVDKQRIQKPPNWRGKDMNENPTRRKRSLATNEQKQSNKKQKPNTNNFENEKIKKNTTSENE